MASIKQHAYIKNLNLSVANVKCATVKPPAKKKKKKYQVRKLRTVQTKVGKNTHKSSPLSSCMNSDFDGTNGRLVGVSEHSSMNPVRQNKQLCVKEPKYSSTYSIKPSPRLQIQS